MKTDDQRMAGDKESAAVSDADAPAQTSVSLLERLRGRLSALPVPAAVRRAASDRSVRAALFAFTLSRVIVLVIFVLIGLLKTAPDAFPGHFDAYISLEKAPVARVLRHEVLTADVNWYLGIAEHGYEHIPFNADVPRHWAFFPLFPVLWRLASLVTGELA